MLRKPLDFWDTIVSQTSTYLGLIDEQWCGEVIRTVPTVKHGSGSLMFHEERSWKIGHTGSYNGSLLLQANTKREPATVSTAIRTWDELHIYA